MSSSNSGSGQDLTPNLSMYKKFDPFSEEFNLNKAGNLNQGGYGTIVQTGNYIIKIQDNFPAFVRELSILRSIEHPNIIRIEGWTNDNKNFYMAQKKGISIYEAINETKELNMGKFYNNIFDKMFNAIDFLHQGNIVHLDIKKDNIVFFKTGNIYEPCLIDFGLATYGYRYSNGLFVKPDIAYSLDNIDPEFGYEKYNSSDSDFYSLAITMYKILEIIINNYLDNNKKTLEVKLFISDLDFRKKSIFNYLDNNKKIMKDLGFDEDQLEKISTFCIEATKPIKSRNLNYLQEFKVIYKFEDNNEGTITTTRTKEINFNCTTAYQLVVDYLNKLMLTTNASARTAFLTYHNLHRCFDKNINTDSDKLLNLNKYGSDFDVVRDLNKFALTSLYLSVIAYSSNTQETERKIKDLCSYEFNHFEIIQNSIDMIRSYGDTVVTNTLWDYANCAGSLPTFFNYTMSCDYNPDSIPNEATCDNTDKNISFVDLATKMNNGILTHFDNIKPGKFENTNRTQITPVIKPSVINNEQDYNNLNNIEIQQAAKNIIKTYYMKRENRKVYVWVEVLYFIIAYNPLIKQLYTINPEIMEALNTVLINIITINKDHQQFITNLFKKYDIKI